MPPQARNRPNHSQRPPKQNRAPRDKKKSNEVPKPESATQEDPATVCSICAEVARDWAVGNCHHVVCGDCSHRMRVLYDRKTCVMCNVELKQVAVVPLRLYRQGIALPDVVALNGAFYDTQVGMWFIDRSRHQYLRNVRGFKCSHKICNGRDVQESVFGTSQQLRGHARREHRAVFCDICFSGKKLFISEMQLFTLDRDKSYSSHLRGHLKKEHPMCKFCRKYFLDDEKLYAHLQEKHETCAICERSGRLHEYYVNFEQLERHYRKHHYICKHDSCRGVVFATQIEFQAHEHTQHNANANTRGNRGRALRVNLSELHGERDPRRAQDDSPEDEQLERERQAARRRAFLSSDVVFSGTFNLDDPSADPPPAGGSAAASARVANAAALQNITSAAREAAAREDVVPTRRPDDGFFHPLTLPRDGEEMHTRNATLVREMKSILDAAAYEQFKQASGLFRTGQISAEDYFEAATDVFGLRHAVRDILPELVALMPSPILREPLLRACLKRTNTKGTDAGYLGPSAPVATAEASKASETKEQFPTLNGGPAPRLATVGASNASKTQEQFPTLNGGPAPKSGYASGSRSLADVTLRSLYRNTKPSPGAPFRAPVRRRRVASAIERQLPMDRIFGQQAAASAASSSTPQSATLQREVFPSLSAEAPPQQQSVPAANVSNVPSAAPSMDLSMRVGPVWSVAGSKGKKRGPGRGHGKRPATPPKSVRMSSASQFPTLRETTTTEAPGPSLSTGGARPIQAPARKNKVINVVEIERLRRVTLAKSSLPKIGGSGYGFAWDRKKAQQKRKEIKTSVAVSANANNAAPRPQMKDMRAYPPLQARPTAPAMSGNAMPDLKSLSVSESPSANRGTARNAGQRSAASEEKEDKETDKHDSHAHLKGDSFGKDAVASFLGKRK